MIGASPPVRRFVPVPQVNPTPIYMEPAELEVLRLVDLEGLSQEDAGSKMGFPAELSGGSFKALERRLHNP